MSTSSAPRVLLVEDNPGDAHILREHLRDAGLAWEVHVSETLGEATAALARGDWSVVLLDLGLPDGRGVSLVRAVRTLAPDVPLVVITGLDDERSALAAVREGAQDYLVKGRFDTGRLVDTLRHARARHDLLAELASAVERARASELNLTNALAANADGVVVLDGQGVVRFLNAAAGRLLGADERVGRPLQTVVPSGEGVELRLGDRVVEATRTALVWEGGPAVLLTLRDVSDTRRATALSRQLAHADRLAAVGRLAAGLAHEINNPATYALANLRMAQRLVADRPGTLHELVDDSLDGMERIARVARGLLAFSRIEREGLDDVDVDGVLEDACGLVRNEIRPRATLRWLPGGVGTVRAHRARVVEVATNLLVAAAHRLPEGGSSRQEVRLRTSRVGDHVEIVVEDTAPALDADQLAHAFDPFVDESGTGVGLGLSLAAEIVRHHGGEIRADSTPPEGNRFVVRLPSAPPGPPPRSAPREDLRGLRVLVVDDEPLLLGVFRRMLAACGAEAVTAPGGREALDVLALDDAFDLVLCDVMMPEVSGPDVLAALTDTRLADRVLFCTGGAFTPKMSAFVAQLGRPILEKPFTLDTLRERSLALLAWADAREALRGA